MEPTRVVVSAVNFTEGGPLTVLRDCLSSAAAVLPPDWELIALVHDTAVVDEPRARLMAIPGAKGSWFKRLYWEWFGFSGISKKLRPALWLSLHDISPRVGAVRQAVYCHNPAPFYRVRPREALQEPSLLLFSAFYGLLYRAFIRRNYRVIVQQDWLRKEFQRRLPGLPVVVAYPSLRAPAVHAGAAPGPVPVFLYPALPRVFKNIETLCEAARILIERGARDFEVRLTLDGTENRYARRLYSRYGKIRQIRFIGRRTAKEMPAQYGEASALVFPSRLETWGLPISEAKAQRLPLLVADLPYAHETVGAYDLVSFFPATSPEALADLMLAKLKGTWLPGGNGYHEPAPPFAPDWESLWGMLIAQLPARTTGTAPSSPESSK